MSLPWPLLLVRFCYHSNLYYFNQHVINRVLDTPPRILTIPTKFRAEFGQIGRNLVGIDFQ